MTKRYDNWPAWRDAFNLNETRVWNPPSQNCVRKSFVLPRNSWVVNSYDSSPKSYDWLLASYLGRLSSFFCFCIYWIIPFAMANIQPGKSQHLGGQLDFLFLNECGWSIRWTHCLSVSLNVFLKKAQDMSFGRVYQVKYYKKKRSAKGVTWISKMFVFLLLIQARQFEKTFVVKKLI